MDQSVGGDSLHDQLIEAGQSVPGFLRGAVVAIGNFDGVHRGHQAVLAEAEALAEPDGRPVALLTFEPHPRIVLGLEPDLLFPIGPEPRCYVLDNYGDARSGGRRHEGIDILADVGQDVYAVVDGTLVGQTDASASLSGNSWGLTADDGVYYFFAHLSAFAEGLQVGDRVRRGQVIGYVGDTGNPGPGNYHLHFEVHPGGLRAAPVDPLPLLTVTDVCTVW